MRLRLAICLILTAGCDGPGPDYRGVEPARVTMGKSVFDIRIKGRRAEAVRVGAQWAPRLAAVGPQAVLAIERVSGCRVERLTGDQAMMQATLDCGTVAPASRRPRPYLECDAFELDGDLSELICYPFP